MNDEKQPQPLPEQEPVGEVEAVEPFADEVPMPLDFWMRIIDENLQIKILWFLKVFNLEIVNEVHHVNDMEENIFYVRERIHEPMVKNEPVNEDDYTG